jgi:Endomembrane protein 70
VIDCEAIAADADWVCSSSHSQPAAEACCLPVQIHWFSIFNSFMMVLFLTGLVAMILLRTLKRDYAR